MITVWIAITVFSSSALMMPSARTIMFPKDVIEPLAKIKKSVRILRGETSDHIFSHIIEPLSMGFVNWNDLIGQGCCKMLLIWYDVFKS